MCLCSTSKEQKSFPNFWFHLALDHKPGCLIVSAPNNSNEKNLALRNTRL